MNKRILIFIEQNREQGQVARYFTDKDYQLTFCYSMSELTQKLSTRHFDLVLVNLTKPASYLLEVVHHIRNKSTCVLWLCTDKLPENTLITLLKAGADNCLTQRRFNHELLARIEVFFRRKLYEQGSTEKQVLTVSELSLCLVTRALTFNGEQVTITGIEFELLQLLMSNSGCVVSRDAIAENIFNRSILYCSKSVNMHISNIRKKLAALSDRQLLADGSYIKTVRGNGYVFVPATTAI
ncbi:response regulator transcription factor [Thalassotalea agariperforans]